MIEAMFSPISRRVLVLAGLASLAACDSGAPTKPPAAGGQTPPKGTEATVDIAELMKEGSLPDQVLGNANAPVTIVEYASMTCSHCATFHTDAFPVLKEKYIDTGKVRYILRQFPLDPLAYAGALLAQCAGEGRYYPMVDLLFKQQRNWAKLDGAEAALLEVSKQAGFTQETFNACLQDQKTYSALQAIRQKALEKFGIDSTPSFFINGRIQRGAMSPAQLDSVLEPFLAAKK